VNPATSVPRRNIETAGGRATAVRADIRDEYDVERFLEAATREGGAVDAVPAGARDRNAHRQTLRTHPHSH
jgi:NAD(P)-dependent dehydrogenase (short-subunit alcohol dehydrogenase family)